ncbi:MAG: type I-F CRISPR-associated protein Csy2 [Arhodomonas sp.]|nr:type I-F CRISPR-associated protein Csy2 [Arhodomonas sp.]
MRSGRRGALPGNWPEPRDDHRRHPAHPAGGRRHAQPPLTRRGTIPRPRLVSVAETEEDRAKQARWLLRRWLPGFALLGRDDLLHDHYADLQKADPETDLLDAWLDLARFNWAARQEVSEDGSEGEVHWERRSPARGWLGPHSGGVWRTRTPP